MSRLSLLVWAALLTLALLAPAGAADVPDTATAVKPLTVGSVAPTAKLDDANKNSVDLAKVFRQQPTALIFYRGGWCPFCNAHLDEVAKAQPELEKLGYRVIAISPDRPDELKKTVAKHTLTYTLLCDKGMVLSRGFGIAFRLDLDTYQKYTAAGVDLEAAQGNSRHELPVPAVFLLDAKGVIRFASWNADYKQRLSAADLIAAAQKAVAK